MPLKNNQIKIEQKSKQTNESSHHRHQQRFAKICRPQSTAKLPAVLFASPPLDSILDLLAAANTLGSNDNVSHLGSVPFAKRLQASSREQQHRLPPLWAAHICFPSLTTWTALEKSVFKNRQCFYLLPSAWKSQEKIAAQSYTAAAVAAVGFIGSWLVDQQCVCAQNSRRWRSRERKLKKKKNKNYWTAVAWFTYRKQVRDWMNFHCKVRS